MIGDLPPEFELSKYLSHARNSDLRFMNEMQALQHYAQYGEKEGRVCGSVDSRATFVKLIPIDARILEIGPFFTPAFRRPGHNVQYIDCLSTEPLRKRAATMAGGDPAKVPEIDFVWTGQPYSSLIPRNFEVVFSCHNIEHHPCLIEHLRQVTSILSPGGRYFAIVPDKRYCFDHFLPESTIADVLDAFLARRSKHAFKDVLEHGFLTAHNDPRRHWIGDHGKQPSVDRSDDAVMERLASRIKKLGNSDEYIDVHGWQFTPRSFRQIVGVLSRLGLIELSVERVYPTLRFSNEFYAVLARVDG